MDLETQIFLFYLALIVLPASALYYLSAPENKMVYSLRAALGGIILSFVLWYDYGQKMVQAQGMKSEMAPDF